MLRSLDDLIPNLFGNSWKSKARGSVLFAAEVETVFRHFGEVTSIDLIFNDHRDGTAHTFINRSDENRIIGDKLEGMTIPSKKGANRGVGGGITSQKFFVGVGYISRTVQKIPTRSQVAQGLVRESLFEFRRNDRLHARLAQVVRGVVRQDLGIIGCSTAMLDF